MLLYKPISVLLVKEETVYFIAVQQCHLCVNKALLSLPLMEGKNFTPEGKHRLALFLGWILIKNLFSYKKIDEYSF